jgi:hypothetical protein
MELAKEVLANNDVLTVESVAPAQSASNT